MYMYAALGIISLSLAIASSMNIVKSTYCNGVVASSSSSITRILYFFGVTMDRNNVPQCPSSAPMLYYSTRPESIRGASPSLKSTALISIS